MTVYKLLLKLMQGIRSLALAVYPTQDNNPPLTIMNKIFLAVLVFGFAMASAAPSNAKQTWRFKNVFSRVFFFNSGLMYG